MLIPEPWRCGDCTNFRRCKSFIGSLRGDEPHCDWAPSRFRLDCIGVLGRLLSEAGATLTLHGEPVTADELRAFGRGVVEGKIQAAVRRQQAVGNAVSEARSEEPR